MPLEGTQAQQFGREEPNGCKFRTESTGGHWVLPELLADVRTKCIRELISLGCQDPDRAKLAGYEAVVAMLYEAEGRLRVMGAPILQAHRRGSRPNA